MSEWLVQMLFLFITSVYLHDSFLSVFCFKSLMRSTLWSLTVDSFLVGHLCPFVSTSCVFTLTFCDIESFFLLPLFWYALRTQRSSVHQIIICSHVFVDVSGISNAFLLAVLNSRQHTYCIRQSCLWSYGSYIYNFLCNQSLSSLTLRVRIPLMASVLHMLCDKVGDCLRQIGGFLRTPEPIELTTTVSLKYCWKWR